MRIAALLLCVAVLSSCAHRVDAPPVDSTPLDQQLNAVATLHNQGRYDQFKACFAKNATIQLPATPRPASVDQYLQAMIAAPYSIAFSNTTVVYSFSNRAATRSTLTVSAPNRPSLKESATVDWVVEDGSWRISRIAVADWPAILGTWKRSGLKDEGSMELRVLPGGNYVIYLAEDYTLPAFKGRYTLEGNKIFFTDTSANDAKLFQSGMGSYIVTRTATGVDFRKVDEENTWRAERFEGAWTGSR